MKIKKVLQKKNYFNYTDFNVLGSSPEILVRLRKGDVTISPIAGTRPRGKTLKEDKKYESDLLNDKKEYCLTKSFQKSIHNSRKKFTLDDLHRIQKRNEQIGREAELVVLDYENSKIKEMGLVDKHARYVADDLSLGYDIISYTNTNENTIQRIFIEVKTMSIGNGFYWSKNEIMSSERLGEEYYLYLLPHDENGISR